MPGRRITARFPAGQYGKGRHAAQLSGERASGSLGQESGCWAARGVREGREELGCGRLGQESLGPWGREEKEVAGWAASGFGLDAGFGFSSFLLLFYFYF